MANNIKKIGLAAIILGIVCFISHVLLHFYGNSLLFTGLFLVMAGTYVYIKGWKREGK
ncbi:MAG: hypothetical protein E6507_05290 [Prevotella bivia]|uniref:Uncharacterized protein n=1 Tax=Prevotella bivia TaxID=28125 RepID=A0A137SZK2_9BACT|nr:hypothetical protein [Prevotella bivia]EFB92142.1 hypothetical protein HMPREF0648_0904 [Prevotella bivia JCVIHMP010]KXO17837.1 hypothetical protein HMPREF3202_00591 [Prevotella bivia]KXU59089.1 hypothetical protein HMPREF3218_0200751 [Prevotella bivia]MDK7762087.1 hypothetical protein [Prevotella bivia]MDU2113124.1 hypothetical protein [Prevotella bivia]